MSTVIPEITSDDLRDARDEAIDHAKQGAEDAKHCATEVCGKIREKADSAMTCTGDYVKKHPVPVVLGALAFGVALGYTIYSSRRESAYTEKYVGGPFGNARDLLLSALAPVGDRLHDAYGSARSHAHKAAESIHDFDPRNPIDCLSSKLRRAGQTLKFW
jgi:ElaB/YqjD/DUF883 family membrane-anchored ribosome-binding protein